MYSTSKIIFFVVFLLYITPASVLLADDVEVKVIPVTGNISMVTGDGGNIGLFIGEDGTFLIDDQYAPLTEKILAAIKEAGGELPRFLLNTHYHFDHTGGNENFGGKGVLIFSHDNVRQRLVSGAFLKPFNAKVEPTAKEGLPVVTFSEDISFHLNGDTVHAVHVAPAHTDGDSFIHFMEANVIHAGDVFFNGFYPFIDVDHGGSLKGMIQAADVILQLANENTRIIPGHGPLASKADLLHYRNMLALVYERLNALKVEGKSAEEAAAAKPLKDLEEEWGDGLFTSEAWIKIIYNGV